jgi:hypothetical protein
LTGAAAAAGEAAGTGAAPIGGMLDDSWFEITRHGTWLLREIPRPGEAGAAPPPAPKLTAADLTYASAYIDDGAPSDYALSRLAQRT